jgi:hypothetical protein
MGITKSLCGMTRRDKMWSEEDIRRKSGVAVEGNEPKKYGRDM